MDKIYKLSVFDSRFMTFKQLKAIFTSFEQARAAAKAPGHYKISSGLNKVWETLEEFHVK